MNATFCKDYFYPIMQSKLTMSIVATCIVVALVIGFLAFLAYLYVEANKEGTLASSEDERCETKREKRKLVVYAVFVVAICCFALPTIIKDFSNYVYDINNESYVVVKGDFTVESATYGWGRFSDDVYTITYEKDGEDISVDVDTTECAVDAGRYTDAVLVYSSKAKIVLYFEE